MSQLPPLRSRKQIEENLPSQRDLEKARTGELTLRASERIALSELAELQRLEARQRVEPATREKEARDWRDKLDEQRSLMAEEDAAIEDERAKVAAMDDTQRMRYVARQEAAARRLPDEVVDGRLPEHLRIRNGQWLLRDAIRIEDAEKAGRERQARENDPKLVKRQAKFDTAVQAIDAKRQAAFDQAHAAHDEALAAIRENAQSELDRLGARPELQEV